MFRGITRGLQLIADFMALLLLATERANPQAVLEGVSVGRQWLRETVDAAGAVKINILGLVLGSTDPWRDSRMMFQAYQAKWKGRL